uniref:Polypeptide N-acetylgalactosaminyltransferase 9 n=1 Tax=Cacopsylla melanoneura TaxID=428564 RepID=A0A8D9E6X6_9HEMI
MCSSITFSLVLLTLGWLEPLMDRIARNKQNVVCPVIRSINDKTLEINLSKNKIHVGGFTWNLQVILICTRSSWYITTRSCFSPAGHLVFSFTSIHFDSHYIIHILEHLNTVQHKISDRLRDW